MKTGPIEKLRKISGRLRRILTARGEPSTIEPPRPRILIVDNEESVCSSMSEYLVLHGSRVDTAQELEEAETLIDKTEYSVIIVELRLGVTPIADGLRIIRLVHDRYPKTRVVVLTAFGSPEVEEEARRCGADAFLRKPQALSQVARVVYGLIESPPKRAAKSS